MEADDSIFGCDYSSSGEINKKGDILLVEGLDNAKQNIRNNLLTKKGYYPSVDTEWGSEIFEVLGEDTNKDSIDAIIVHIKNAMRANPRVLDISQIEPYVTIDNRLIFKIELILVNGTEDTINIEFGGIE